MIAFLVLAHSDPEQVRRLTERLHPHDVYVHVDRKTDLDDGWLSLNAELVADRVPVYWAGFSQVQATINLLRAALDSGREHERIVLLSGACYPIRPVKDLTKLFDDSPQLNFLKYVAVSGSGHLPKLTNRFYFRDRILSPEFVTRFASARRLERVIRKLLEVVCLPLRKGRPAWTRYHGSAYWAITGDCAREILKTVDSRLGRQMRRYYRTAFASDEQFFHTIVGNSRFASVSTGEQPYSGRGTYKSANLHFIDPSLTKWFEFADLSAVRASGQYFVRKVRTQSSTTLLDALDEADR
ncbi:MAG: beta-1,6-N-acetylglucosaminyltransferase [Glaciihabitans sp.]